jgi:hypothetical protein
VFFSNQDLSAPLSPVPDSLGVSLRLYTRASNRMSWQLREQMEQKPMLALFDWVRSFQNISQNHCLFAFAVAFGF